ncbi:MAG: efflux RND transporter permease subunit, partial [Kiritimatiellae bacterium]|nr:efflux RND transporter permease subunit [Kiritimatiellia bacterium]
IFVAVAIPLSMLISFTVLALMGQTLNMMVLFALVLAVGMLVDNAIVIVENIYRNHTLGLSREESARRGTSEVAWPVITSTLTTLAAFSPLLFWPDMMGQFMGYLPKTLIVVLSASLFVAIVVNPAICSVLISRGKKRVIKKTRMDICTEVYERFLREALKHCWPVLLIGVSFLVLSMLLYAAFGEGKELFPDVEPRNAVLSLSYPQGTSIEKTDIAMRAIEDSLENYEDVIFYLTTVGGGAGLGPWGSGGGGHKAQIHVEFKKWEDRKGLTSKLVDTIRRDVGLVPGAELKVEKQREGPPMGDPISIELSGDNFETLSSLSSKIMNEVKMVPGLVDVHDDFEEALPELQFRVDRVRAALLGLDTQEIGMFLRTAIYGTEASKLRADEDEYDITLRLPSGQRDSAKLLDQIYIPTHRGEAVPLSSLGTVVYAGGRGSISRKNQKRVITIGGNNEGRGTDKVLKDVRNIVDKIELPRGYAVGYAGDSKEMEESGAFLRRAFGIALGLMLVVLVIQFNSGLLPGLILATVILSLIGVMWGLLLCRMRFGVILTGIGVISLAGIVVNNAIVLIDCVLQRRKEGLDSMEAVVAAGKMRLRPVILTAITTILGLIPMALGWTLDIHTFPPMLTAGAETSQWWAPMAVAVIFGLGFATVLTLILLPVMYSLSDSFAVFLRKLTRLGAESNYP